LPFRSCWNWFQKPRSGAWKTAIYRHPDMSNKQKKGTGARLAEWEAGTYTLTMPSTLETPTPGRDVFWTAEEFLDWLEPGRHADLIDGEKCRHEPVSLSHAHLINFLDELLRRWLRQSGAGGRLYREVVAVKLGQRNVFLPDLCWFDKTQATRLPSTHAPIPPRWVCEVLSPRTAHRDEGPKFAAYEEHGVREYWLLDPDRLDHRFFKTDGEYLREFAAGEQIIHSAELPGFAVRREWLNPGAIPDVDACLAEIPKLSAPPA